MSYEAEERTEHTLFGLKFTATLSEQRELWMSLQMSKESRAWGITRNLCNLTVARGILPEMEALAERMEDTDAAMTRLAHRLINQLVAEQSGG